MNQRITLGLAAAIETLLRILAAIRLKRSLPHDVDLAALGVVMAGVLGPAWGALYRALAAARLSVEADGPRSSKIAAASDQEVLAALLRSEAVEAVDELLVDVARHYLPTRTRGWDLSQVAHLVEREREGLGMSPEVSGAWLTVYGSVHERGEAQTLKPGECGDEGDDGLDTARSVPLLVVEVPALVHGVDGNRALELIASQLREVMACRVDVAPRGPGLVLRLGVPVDTTALSHAVEKRRAGRLQLVAEGG